MREAMVLLSILGAAAGQGTDRPAPLDEVVRRAIQAYYEQRCAAAASTQPREGAAEPGRKDARVPGPPGSSADGRVGRLARTIWPEGPLPAERVGWFCELFAKVAVKDASLVYVDMTARRDEEGVVLRGATNAPSYVGGLTEALAAVGIAGVRSEARTLPDREKLGARLFGVCRVPTALTYNRPSESGGLQTQLLYGEPVFLLDRAEGFYLLHAGEGYWGWVREEAVQPLAENDFAPFQRLPRAVFVTDLQMERTNIPRGGTAPFVRTEGDKSVVLSPEGSEMVVPSSVLRVGTADAGAAEARVKAALDFMGSPYLFGGRSGRGLDCSGLVTNVWARAAGERTARDAWQQALAGELVATWWHRENIQPGDQVFFIDPTGRIYHTGVAISATHILHAAPPAVQIGSFVKGDRLYDARLDRDFFMVKRP